MKRYELWTSATSRSFFREDNEQVRRLAHEDGETLTWETMARGYNDAQRALHEYLGLGEYQPMLRPDGSVYPEDEDDD